MIGPCAAIGAGGTHVHMIKGRAGTWPCSRNVYGAELSRPNHGYPSISKCCCVIFLASRCLRRWQGAVATMSCFGALLTLLAIYGATRKSSPHTTCVSHPRLIYNIHVADCQSQHIHRRPRRTQYEDRETYCPRRILRSLPYHSRLEICKLPFPANYHS